MSINKILALLLAVAVLLAPALTRAGDAQAAVPDHHAQMMGNGHCQPDKAAADEGKDRSSRHDKAGKDCCIATCTAFAVQPAVAAVDEAVHKSRALFAAPLFHAGAPAELATPPPRLT